MYVGGLTGMKAGWMVVITTIGCGTGCMIGAGTVGMAWGTAWYGIIGSWGIGWYGIIC